MDISKELAFYGAYHTNFENKIIHIVCVPLILWSAFLIFGLVHRLIPFFAWIAYAAFYIYLEPVVGSLAATFYFFVFLSSDYLLKSQKVKVGAKAVPKITKWTIIKLALVAQLLGWGLQVFVGHAIFEGRKPALLDSLVQAFSLAPLFVVYELIWTVVPGFQSELRMNVENQVQEIHMKWA